MFQPQLADPPAWKDDLGNKTAYLTWQAQCHVALSRIGLYTTAMLERIPQALPTPAERHAIARCYGEWLEFTVTLHPYVCEMRIVKYPSGETHPVTGDMQYKRVVENISIHAHMEMSRLYYLLHYERLTREQRAMAGAPGPKGPTGPGSIGGLESVPDVICSLNHLKSHGNADVWCKGWANFGASPGLSQGSGPGLGDVPILAYTQSQVKAAIMLLTENLNEYPPCPDVVRMMELLFIANSVWMCLPSTRDILDAEDSYIDMEDGQTRRVSRSYIMWSTIYFGEVLRRLFYVRLIGRSKLPDPVRPSPAQVELMRRWIKRTVYKMPDDNFEDLHSQVVEECYAYPGDDLWMRFQWPDRTPARVEILAELRPVRSRAYQSEVMLSKEGLLAEDTHVTRMFVLGVVHQTLHGAHGLDFIRAIVVPNAKIESRGIYSVPCPLIVQVFSHFWLHDTLGPGPGTGPGGGGGGAVLWSTDIYETLAAWFLRLSREHRGFAFKTDLTSVIQDIFQTEAT